MLRGRTKLWMLTMSLGVVALTQSGCGDTIGVIDSPDEHGKLILNPKNGDTIVWSGLTPSFLGPNPCETNSSKPSQCKVTQASGKYLYDCDFCTDPEVVVGPEIGIKSRFAATARATAVSKSVSAWCESGAIKLAHNPVTYSTSAGDSVQTRWIATGAEPIESWQVTFDSNPKPGCDETDIGTKANTCTFKPTASATYNYTFTSTGGACKGVSGKGQIGVTVQ